MEWILWHHLLFCITDKLWPAVLYNKNQCIPIMAFNKPKTWCMYVSKSQFNFKFFVCYIYEPSPKEVHAFILTHVCMCSKLLAECGHVMNCGKNVYGTCRCTANCGQNSHSKVVGCEY
jgi:hypothetical protein